MVFNRVTVPGAGIELEVKPGQHPVWGVAEFYGDAYNNSIVLDSAEAEGLRVQLNEKLGRGAAMTNWDGAPSVAMMAISVAMAHGETDLAADLCAFWGKLKSEEFSLESWKALGLEGEPG